MTTTQMTAPVAVTDGFGLVLSTDPVAATSYRRGVHELLAGRPEALLSFARAARHDPSFALATTGIAVATSVVGDGIRWRALQRSRTTARFATRRERQHVDIVAAALGDDPGAALALAVEHLHEFPEDAVVLSVVSRAVADSADPDLAAELRRLIAHVLEDR